MDDLDDDPFDYALTGKTAADADSWDSIGGSSSTTPSSSNLLSTLTGLTGIATQVYGAVKKPGVTTSVASSASSALSKIVPWLIIGAVAFFAIRMFKSK